eukprot:TRINITY_DN16990_c0_g2_i3.p1 TRINITY_DN16990_c0_g2~~TRINITY_DN16990_c0_g2_i3.p1  ORF type:complete len:957 (+),score=258.99 TRINITY_DN16990_c0_g2_i3:70-2871(+)
MALVTVEDDAQAPPLTPGGGTAQLGDVRVALAIAFRYRTACQHRRWREAEVAASELASAARRASAGGEDDISAPGLALGRGEAEALWVASSSARAGLLLVVSAFSAHADASRQRQQQQHQTGGFPMPAACAPPVDLSLATAASCLALMPDVWPAGACDDLLGMAGAVEALLRVAACGGGAAGNGILQSSSSGVEDGARGDGFAALRARRAAAELLAALLETAAPAWRRQAELALLLESSHVAPMQLLVGTLLGWAPDPRLHEVLLELLWRALRRVSPGAGLAALAAWHPALVRLESVQTGLCARIQSLTPDDLLACAQALALELGAQGEPPFLACQWRLDGGCSWGDAEDALAVFTTYALACHPEGEPDPAWEVPWEAVLAQDVHTLPEGGSLLRLSVDAALLTRLIAAPSATAGESETQAETAVQLMNVDLLFDVSASVVYALLQEAWQPRQLADGSCGSVAPHARSSVLTPWQQVAASSVSTPGGIAQPDSWQHWDRFSGGAVSQPAASSPFLFAQSAAAAAADLPSVPAPADAAGGASAAFGATTPTKNGAGPCKQNDVIIQVDASPGPPGADENMEKSTGAARSKGEAEAAWPAAASVDEVASAQPKPAEAKPQTASAAASAAAAPAPRPAAAATNPAAEAAIARAASAAALRRSTQTAAPKRQAFPAPATSVSSSAPVAASELLRRLFDKRSSRSTPAGAQRGRGLAAAAAAIGATAAAASATAKGAVAKPTAPAAPETMVRGYSALATGTLRALCKARGLPASGERTELLAQLAPPPAAVPAAVAAPGVTVAASAAQARPSRSTAAAAAAPAHAPAAPPAAVAASAAMAETKFAPSAAVAAFARSGGGGGVGGKGAGAGEGGKDPAVSKVLMDAARLAKEVAEVQRQFRESKRSVLDSSSRADALLDDISGSNSYRRSFVFLDVRVE